ncbi:MAG: sulfide/dihydroorotate dehydrogenase-like FAD/NAD-binding protein [Erysipelotrichaceae bacterium]|nr:sulfide/dihydroorotate dehydrogenase-like FAD/NAD-binding protein [Erysipelotrichaceae bacterium]
MYKILKKEKLNDVVELMEIKAPNVSRKCEAGQFIILRASEDGERIPLTIADFDREKETITIIYQIVGFSTKQLSKLNVGDDLVNFVGPLGVPTTLHQSHQVIGVAGGVGAAPLYPQLHALAKMGVEVDVIIGGRSKDYIIWKDKFEQFCRHVYIATDDGSLGTKGFVTQVLQELIDQGNQFDEVIAIGPVPMMKAVVGVTKPHEIKTSVSLNPIMIDGTGMCGCCRVSVDGKIKFACVDGPDFDGLLVDFDELMNRQRMFKEEEHQVDENSNHICNLMGGANHA